MSTPGIRAYRPMSSNDEKTDLEEVMDRIFGPRQEAAAGAGTTGPDPEPGEAEIEEMLETLQEHRHGKTPDEDLGTVADRLFI